LQIPIATTLENKNFLRRQIGRYIKDKGTDVKVQKA
jgi:hypothetical protein